MTTNALLILVTISSQIVMNVNRSTYEVKLTSDVNTLNRSVSAYLNAGGNVNDVQTSAEMIRRLKTSSNLKGRIPGLSGNFVDTRFSIRTQDLDEAASDTLRAFWDKNKKRFVTANKGREGIKEFYLSKTHQATSDVHHTSSGDGVSPQTWTWGHHDEPKAEPVNPTVVTTVGDGLIGDDPVLVSFIPTGLGGEDHLGRLQPPLLSHADGTKLRLIDLNDKGLAKLYYSIDYGGWELYASPVAISDDSVVSAQAISTRLAWSDSPMASDVFSNLVQNSLFNRQLDSDNQWADYDDLKVLEDTAKSSAKDAFSQAEAAELLYQDLRNDHQVGELVLAQAYDLATRAQAAAAAAAESAELATQVAERAKFLASELSLRAETDASLADDAEKAVVRALNALAFMEEAIADSGDAQIAATGANSIMIEMTAVTMY